MKKIFPLILMFCFSIITFAQVPPPPPDQGEDASGGFGAPATPPTPIDDYLPFLLAAAVMIGIYFVVKYSKKSLVD